MSNMISTYTIFCVLSSLSIVWCQESPNAEARAVIESAEFNDENLDTGNYNFRFQTSNGISRNEEANSVTRNKDVVLKVAGSYAYTGPDGKRYEVTYTADETGFYPVGAHFKTPKVSPWPAQNSLDDDSSGSSGENVAINLSQGGDSSTVSIQDQQAFLNVSQSGSLNTVTSENNQEVFLNGSGSGSSSTVSANKDVHNLYLPPDAPNADVINLLQYQSDEIGKAIAERGAIYETREAFDEDYFLGSPSQVVFYITRPRGFSMLAKNKPRGFSLPS